MTLESTSRPVILRRGVETAACIAATALVAGDRSGLLRKHPRDGLLFARRCLSLQGEDCMALCTDATSAVVTCLL